MQIPTTSSAYGGNEAQRVLSMLLRQQTPPSGQDLPGANSAAATASPTTTSTPNSNPLQFASQTLANLLSTQEQSSSGSASTSDFATQLIKAVDTDGDGSLSLDEIKSALGTTSTTASNDISSALSKLDTNGDGKLSASELTTGLQAAKGGHKAHHHHAPSSTDMAQQLISATDTDGDGSLSLSEIQSALGTSSSTSADTLQATLAKLDTDGNGKLSVSELSSALDAFRNAHQRGAATAGTTTTTQTSVTV